MGLLKRLFGRRSSEDAHHPSLNQDPVVVFPPDEDVVLPILRADWGWLVEGEVRVPFATAWGDLVLVEPDGSNARFLDTHAGELHDLGCAEDGIRAAFREDEHRALLMAEIAIPTQLLPDIGILPPGKVLQLTIPAVLGGALDPDNVDRISLGLHLTIQGQLLDQVRSLPEGTQIDDIQFI